MCCRSCASLPDRLRSGKSGAVVSATEAISTERVLPVVSQQLVEVSRISWRKHRIVQCSLILATLGFLLATAVVATG